MAKTKGKKLTGMQKAFALAYFKKPRGKDAAIKAGYSVKTADSQASQLLKNPKVHTELARLQSEADDEAILSVTERKVMLSNSARKCYEGLGQFVTVLPDGEVSFDVNEENTKDNPALRKVAFRIQEGTTKVVDGETIQEPDVRTVTVETRDFLAYVQELNKMEGVYLPEAQEGGQNPMIMALLELRAEIEASGESYGPPRLRARFGALYAPVPGGGKAGGNGSKGNGSKGNGSK